MNVDHTIFRGNAQIDHDGGAIYLEGSDNSIALANTMVTRNETLRGDGAIFIDGESNSLEISNSVISNSIDSGAIELQGDGHELNIVSSTIVGNNGSGLTRNLTGVKVFNTVNTTVAILNSILISNSIRNLPPIDSNSFTVQYSAVVDLDDSDGDIAYGGVANNNTDQKPHFVDYASEDF